MEKWKLVPGCDKRYEVSDAGHIRNSASHKVYKPWICKNGYAYVSIVSHGKRSKVSVHRLVAACFIPNPENKPCVNHIDGNKSNNNVDNLEWSTFSENIKHSWDSGLRVMTNSGREALSASRRKSVKCSNGVVYKSSADASRDLGISVQSICNALKGRSHSAGGYTFHYN